MQDLSTTFTLFFQKKFSRIYKVTEKQNDLLFARKKSAVNFRY